MFYSSLTHALRCYQPNFFIINAYSVTSGSKCSQENASLRLNSTVAPSAKAMCFDSLDNQLTLIDATGWTVWIVLCAYVLMQVV
ncbi:hypothetical protein WN943_001667 [Citrus x changshan-huyou]